MFVGFGGVVVRQAVKEGADWFVTDFQELIDALLEETELKEKLVSA